VSDAILTASAAPVEPASTGLEAVLAELEGQRRRALKSYCITLLAVVACIPIIVAPILVIAWSASAPETASGDLPSLIRARLMPYPTQVGVVALAWPLVLAYVALWAMRRFMFGPRNEYLSNYKHRVLAVVCRQHFPGIGYEPHGGMPWALLDNSGLFPYVSDVYSSEDRFVGRWGATDVCFAEATAQRIEKRGWGKDKETEYVTYFRGVIFSADFHKHFHCTARLLPKGADAPRLPAQEPVALEDPRFMAVFDVWATDQVDIRYILSPGMMERLSTLGSRFPGLRARFCQGNLLLLLPGSRDRFEPSVLKRAHNRDQIESFIADVRACLSVVDALNLNTRIWSKS